MHERGATVEHVAQAAVKELEAKIDVVEVEREFAAEAADEFEVLRLYGQTRSRDGNGVGDRDEFAVVPRVVAVATGVEVGGPTITTNNAAVLDAAVGVEETGADGADSGELTMEGEALEPVGSNDFGVVVEEQQGWPVGPTGPEVARQRN
ncbi:MAG: hypothetical protein R2706_16590 [Acidimicrobiales bacterium]